MTGVNSELSYLPSLFSRMTYFVMLFELMALKMLSSTLCFCLIFQYFHACSVQPRRNRKTIIDLLNQAIASGSNGIYHLRHLSQDGNFSSNQGSTGNIIRATTGSTVVFRCSGSNVNLSPNPQPASSQILFNGQSHNFTSKRRRKRENRDDGFVCCNCTSQCDTKKLLREMIIRPDRVTDSFLVELGNFSHIHSGTYDCVRFNDNQWVLTQTYLVSPQLTALEVFQPPMQNVTAKVGDDIRLRCFVKFWTLRGSLEKRFMWRNEDYLIIAPGIRAFGARMESRQGSRLGVLTEHDLDLKCRCLSTLTIFDVRESDTGSYQCWFKIDDLFHEWVMQEVYLSVIS
ncbi:uncharacterized protein LOC129586463 [Paramacrobiotus metropolitanus]|uniref:uncharacterized protein LOC129586463 n=1 Tax=Paramacrobiotus metropolitanus TaxID=2943436 RepID=UPI002445C58E|nr:uncharacterized protein LOC129586463 [Paramacrobiotus metropolitanus]